MMGWDSGTLISAVEDAFGFSIPEEEVAKLKNLGNLFEYILAHRIHGKRQNQLNSIALYKIRQAMMTVLHLPKEELQESTALSAIIPKHRRRLWRRLHEKSGLRLPQLQRPLWLVRVSFLIVLALSLAMPLCFSLTLFRGALLVSILTAVAAGYALVQLTKLAETKFQPGCVTLGDLANGVMARNFQAMVEESERFSTDAEIWETLCLVVAKQLDIPPNNLTRNTKLSQDRSVDFGDKPLLLPISVIDSTLGFTTESYA